MDWDRTDTFGRDEYNFYNDANTWIGRYIPEENKVIIPHPITKEELKFIYNIIKYR